MTGAPSYMQAWHPARGVTFDGVRRDIAIGEVIRAMGRRTPDDTVAQRRYRFAFILILPPGRRAVRRRHGDDRELPAAVRKLLRESDRPIAPSADTSLRRSLKLSLFPSAAVLEGGSGTATITVQTAPAVDTPVSFQTVNGDAKLACFRHYSRRRLDGVIHLLGRPRRGGGGHRRARRSPL